jgi:hypothetical protein
MKSISKWFSSTKIRDEKKEALTLTERNICTAQKINKKRKQNKLKRNRNK